MSFTGGHAIRTVLSSVCEELGDHTWNAFPSFLRNGNFLAVGRARQGSAQCVKKNLPASKPLPFPAPGPLSPPGHPLQIPLLLARAARPARDTDNAHRIGARRHAR